VTSFNPAPKPQPRPKRSRLPLKKVNPERAKKREARDFGAKGEWIRRQPCCVLGKHTGDWMADFGGARFQVQIVAAHFPSRGAGGRAENLVPMAWHIHELAHQNEKAIERMYGVRFKELAAYYEKLWQREQARRAP
jgi:hypothetical protein